MVTIDSCNSVIKILWSLLQKHLTIILRHDNDL